MKFFKGRNKKTKQVEPVPRNIVEIDADHIKFQSEAGRITYQIYALKRHLNAVNEQLLAINYEKNKRLELNKAEVNNETN